MRQDEDAPSSRRAWSSSRPVSAPEVQLWGPLRDLKQLLWRLYEEAGSPAYQTVASWTQKRSSPVGKSAVGRYLTEPELPARQDATITLAAVMAAHGPRDVDAVCDQVRRLWLAAREWKPFGTLIEDLGDPFALEIHRAIDPGRGYTDLPLLPPYVKRDHDRRLAERVQKAAEGHSMVVVLVGGSSTGKTRACWEAIHRLPQGWRLWHPYEPTRPDAALDAMDNVGPRTVIWLNEAQFYLLTEGSDQGERVAARLRALLTDKDRTPVLMLGTLWPQYWAILTHRPDSDKPDPHAQARELLAGAHIPVAESFDQAVVDRLKNSDEQDPRLVEAATRAEDGELTQYLAGAPALLERYDTAPHAAKALLTAAMDLRRLGHGPNIPLGLLTAATPSYLSGRELARWFLLR